MRAMRAMPSRTAFIVPPFSWMVKACMRSWRLSCCEDSRLLIWFAPQPSPITCVAKKFDARDARDAFAHRLHRAALLLDGEGVHALVALELLRGQQVVDLVCLAAEADHLRGKEIRVARIARHRAAQDVHAFTLGRHAAAGLVGERHH